MKHTAPSTPAHPVIIAGALADLEGQSLYGFILEEPRGQQAIWRAVITQAIMDARSNSQKSEDRRARAEAREWLGSDDFYTVCDRAGLEPDYVLEKAIIALDPDFHWRKPAGQGWRVQARLKAEGNA